MTENGFGKRTRVSEYPRKGRGGMGVQTVKLTEARGKLVGARVVRDGYQVMLISTGGTVIKMPVEDVKRLGRSTQGVIVMRLREGEIVSTLAPVVDSSGDDDDADDLLDTDVGRPTVEAMPRTARERADEDERVAVEPDDDPNDVADARVHGRALPFREARALWSDCYSGWAATDRRRRADGLHEAG